MKATAATDNPISTVIKELTDALTKGNAHASFEDAVGGVSPELLDKVPAGLPYSIWQLVEHIRIAQWDILDFCRNPDYKSMDWPKDYWPAERGPARKDDFRKSVAQVLADRKAFIALLHEKGEGIYAAIPHGEGQNLFREALLIVDHTSYHTGELIILRRLLGDWK